MFCSAWIAALAKSMEVTDQTVLEAQIPEFCAVKPLHHPGFVKNELSSVDPLYWLQYCKYNQLYPWNPEKVAGELQKEM